MRLDFSEARRRIARMRQALRLKLPVALERGIRAGHEQHRKKSVAELRALFDRERYILRGQVRQLGFVSGKWTRRKMALGMSPLLGHFTGTLAKAISHAWSSPRTRTGWLYDIRRSSGLIARYRIRGKVFYGVKQKGKTLRAFQTRERQLRDSSGTYMDDYVRSKAPGLGELPPGAIQKEEKAVRLRTRLEFIRAARAVGFETRNAIIFLPLSFRVRR